MLRSLGNVKRRDNGRGVPQAQTDNCTALICLGVLAFTAGFKARYHNKRSQLSAALKDVLFSFTAHCSWPTLQPSRATPRGLSRLLEGQFCLVWCLAGKSRGLGQLVIVGYQGECVAGVGGLVCTLRIWASACTRLIASRVILLSVANRGQSFMRLLHACHRLGPLWHISHVSFLQLTCRQ